VIAEQIARALGGRRNGSGWSARCPAHDDDNPSLSIHDRGGNTLVHCHAGCDQSRVVGALRRRGLWTEGDPTHASRLAGRKSEPRPGENAAERTNHALATWNAAIPANGTPVETYLASRGLRLPPAANLRFHAALRHPASGIWPAMVALVTRGSDGAPMAIHRTFLAGDGRGKAQVEPKKMMLGPCRGGAVRLCTPGRVLMVGEGIETCLAVMRATGEVAWAALSTSGLRGLNLPTNVEEVIVLADGDNDGEMAARDAASRWRREGRRVRIARPPLGMDFNDLLLAQMASTGETSA
jgi:putative DNA primase/helicase